MDCKILVIGRLEKAIIYFYIELPIQAKQCRRICLPPAGPNSIYLWQTKTFTLLLLCCYGCIKVP